VIDMGESTDYWFHANNVSSCHVVAKIPDDIDKRGLKTILKRGALLCKQNTNKLAKNGNIEIVYCPVKNVKKTDVPGLVEFTGGKVIVV
jgi:predicted ribosome quality control (RQC) complex YloA/Tae2 family protein